MVPAAAVIPSLIAFSYVVAVKKLVAVSSIACHFEKIGVFITGKPLHSTAKNDISGRKPRTYYMAARDWRYLMGTGEIG